MIFNFNNVKESGIFYGGQAGDKLGIIIDDERWFLKFPKSMANMRRADMSYTTAQLSEYIGSHVYEILGYDVHKTELGIKDGILVVACKDFTDENDRLFEYRELQNYYNQDLRRALEESFSSSDPERHGTNLDTLLLHLEYNPVLANIPNIKERFWDCVIIDGLINNNDRNSGNWGIIKNMKTNQYRLAPIFDNGGSFSSKLSDRQMRSIMDDPNKFDSSSLNTNSSFYYNGNDLLFKDLIRSLDNNDLDDALYRVVPLIEERFDKIVDFINGIPNSYQGVEVMSDIRKEFYINGMDNRLDHILLPAYDLLMDKENEKGKEL